VEHNQEKKGIKQSLKHFYEKQYKKLLIIPLLLIIFAISQMGYQFASTGDFINRGVSLSGGISVLITKVIDDPLALQEALQKAHPDADFDVRAKEIGVAIDASGIEYETLRPTLDAEFNGLEDEQLSVSMIGARLGKSFFRETMFAMLLSFLFMGIVVLITFRVLAPSLAVILAAASDILVTLAIFNLTGMKLSIAGIAAFLMLIGYSVDTDILLSTRVLKQKRGSIMDRVYSSMKTGLTMTCTTLAAVTVALFVATSDPIIQIMTILLIGLFVDIIMTYFQNVAILRIYLYRKNKHEPHT